MDNRIASKPAETSTMELELMVEDELARLQRQYRIMESDRVAYLDHVKCKMGNENRIISKLKKEQASLIMNLHVADSTNNRRKDENTIVFIKQLLQEHTKFADKIKLRKTYISELEYQIRKVQRQIVAMHVDLNKIQAFRDERLALVRANLVKLENKLETCNNRFGAVLSQNRKLREDIDHLINERHLFNKQWDFLFNQLECSKKFMMDLIEQESLAYDQREEWCQKLEALRIRTLSDAQYHSEEMRELQRTLDHDVSLQNFLQIKGQRRIAGYMLKKELLKREEAKIELRKRTEKYSQILKDIQEYANDTDVDHLSSQFIKQEEENFALFNYIHELNTELESISDTIGAIQLKTDEQRELHKKRHSKQTENIQYIRKYLVELTEKADEEQEKCIALNQQLRDIFGGVERLFQKINCDNAPILDLLGQVVATERRASVVSKFSTWQWNMDDDSTVVRLQDKTSGVLKKNIVMNVHNVGLYLGVLEDKITESIINIYATQHKNIRSNYRARLEM